MSSAVLFLLGAVALIALGSTLVWLFSRSADLSMRPEQLSQNLRATMRTDPGHEPPSGVTMLPPVERDD